MLVEALQTESLRVQGGFTRCGSCGRRVPLMRPVCTTHGPVARTDGRDFGATAVTAVELQRFPGYRTLQLIGRGGFGSVFAAEPWAGQGKVAIKLARADRPDAGIRLVHEIAVLSDIGPPHVPAVYGSGELEDGVPYVVLEYVEVPTLADRLVEWGGPVSVGTAVTTALAVVRALRSVHARNWVHRDLKPENIFIGDERGVVKICDFGLAGDLFDHNVTSESAVGTVEYMAPEQCERRGDIDARADVYAIGVILYELLAGVPPFWGPPAAVRQSHLSHRPPRIGATSVVPAIPAEVEAIVHRCLAKDPRERFDSSDLLYASLDGVNSTTGSLSVRATPEVAPLIPATPAPPPQDDRRTVSFLFFDTDHDVPTLQKRLVSLGGLLGHVAHGRCVVVYGAELGENPARAALRAARELIRDGVSPRVRLDVGPVSIQRRRDGSKRFLSPLFTRSDRFPGTADPLGVSVTIAASVVLSDLPERVDATLERGGPRSLPTPLRDATEEREADEASADTSSFSLIGREPLLAELVESARRSTSASLPTMVSVLGDVGLGKSRLMSTLGKQLRRLALPGEIVTLRARERALDGADQTVRDLLHWSLDLPLSAPPDGGVALLFERLGGLGRPEAVPAVALALGWVAGDAHGPAVNSGLRTLGVAPGALRSALVGAAGDALRRRAFKNPVIVLLDDAHNADEATLGALLYASLAEANAPLWICATARPGFSEEHPSWGERSARCEIYRLEPLDPASAATLCRRLLLPVEDVPDFAIDRIVERAQAIPLLLVELLRGLRREGLIRRHSKGESYYLATDELDRLPNLPLIEWLAHGEVEVLSAGLKAHAQLLALLGGEVSIPEVAGVLRRLEEHGTDTEFPLDAAVATRRLIAAGLLAQGKAGRVTFRHALVREAVAQGIPEPLRRRVHLAAVVHYLSATTGPDDEPRLAQLAFHAARAGRCEIAENACLDLAERSRARHAYLPAERWYSRALDQPGTDDERRLNAYRGRGLMRYRIGRYQDALADLSIARALAHQQGAIASEVDLLLDEATALDWMDEWTTSHGRVELAQSLGATVDSPLLKARLHLAVGRSLHRFSREEEAAVLLENAATEASTLGDEGYETLVIALIVLGFIHQGLGRLDDAQRALDRAILLCQEHGDDLHLAAALNNRALLWAFLEDRSRMVADMERGLALARKLGLAALELIPQFNLGEFLYLAGDLDAAEPYVRRAIELERRLRGDAGRPVVALLEGRCQLYGGDTKAAGATVSRILQRQQTARALGHTDMLMVPSEEILCAAIDLAIRGGDAEAWDALEERSASCSIGQERIEVLETRALASLRRGQVDEGKHHLDRALALSDRIPNSLRPRLRRHLAELEASATASTALCVATRAGIL